MFLYSLKCIASQNDQEKKVKKLRTQTFFFESVSRFSMGVFHSKNAVISGKKKCDMGICSEYLTAFSNRWSYNAQSKIYPDLEFLREILEDTRERLFRVYSSTSIPTSNHRPIFIYETNFISFSEK